MVAIWAHLLQFGRFCLTPVAGTMVAMATAHDVAARILEIKGPMSAMKLQKLVYYSQAWHLVWDDEALFQEPIEAWANGPVVRELYNEHRGMFMVSRWPKGDSEHLSEAERETVDVVVRFYGDKAAQWLSELTHTEAPWRDARGDLAPGERGNREIPLDAMAEYYGALDARSAAAQP